MIQQFDGYSRLLVHSWKEEYELNKPGVSFQKAGGTDLEIEGEQMSIDFCLELFLLLFLPSTPPSMGKWKSNQLLVLDN